MNSKSSIEEFVKQQTAALRELWFSCDEDQAVLPELVSDSRKAQNEAIMNSLLEWVGGQIDHPLRRVEDKKAITDEAVKRLKDAGKSLFDMDDDQIECIEELGISRCAREFIDQARVFNPFVSFADVYQASRNVWTSNYLQVLMGLPVNLTPSLFAYSMLYPVSDNYLDDPSISREAKIAFDQRFSAWLKGEKAIPQNSSEQDVFDLVTMIEKQYCRDQFPQVYDSLLAIHIAQDKSMRVPKSPLKPNMVDLVSLTFEKGGTSVLADGVLSAGKLDPDLMGVIFNYGAFAQLMDDQEDIAGDLSEKAPTLFSEAARVGKVDQVMNRVFNFAHRVLKGLDRFDNPKANSLKKISMKGIDLLLIDTTLRLERYYSHPYLQKLEAAYPFRFDYVRRVRKMMIKRNITNQRLAGLFLPGVQSSMLTFLDPIQMAFSERRLVSVP